MPRLTWLIIHSLVRPVRSEVKPVDKKEPTPLVEAGSEHQIRYE